MKKLFSILLCILLLCGAAALPAEGAERSYTSAELEAYFDDIAAYKASSCGAADIQDWIRTGLCDSAGRTAEFYIIALSQSGDYDLSSYAEALQSYLDNHEVYSATTREKYALALLACGRTDDYIRRVCDSDIGAQGVMSLVFGLHLLNNGCASALYTADSLIGDILSRQLDDGGWAVIGSVGDTDVTAMTLQALAPYRTARQDVSDAVERALNLLGTLQLESGGFKTMGSENCESAAQVLTTLSALGIDPDTDQRFIKNGVTVPDAMLSYRNRDGSFAHTAGGGFNENATMQAFYALRAYLRMRHGQAPLYLLDRRPSSPAPTERAPQQPTRMPASAAPAASAAASPTSAPPPSAAQSTIPAAAPLTLPTDATAPAASTAPTDHEPSKATPSTVAPTSPASPDDVVPPEQSAGTSYKVYAVIGVLAAAGIACLILFLRKKRGYKRYLAVLLLAGAAIAVILLTSFESKESYARAEDKPSPAGQVTMSISCGVLNDEADKPDYIPDDGVILPETTFSFGEGESVYDILLKASKRCQIPIDNRGAEGSAYIAGIRYLYEYAYGELSGWMYRVNGVFPDEGCQSYRLSDGDRIEWLYTKNIGKDLTSAPVAD